MTQPPAEAERIRGYLQAQATKPIEELIGRVQEGVDELHAAARAVPQASLDSPLDDNWTPMDCLRHITGSDLSVGESIVAAAFDGRVLGLRDRDAEDASRETLIDRHSAGLLQLYERLRTANPAAHLDLMWEHPFFGDLNWREWFIFLRIHDKDHARQLQKMIDAR